LYNVLQKKIRAALSKFVNEELRGNIRGFVFPLGKLIELTYKPYNEAILNAYQGFEDNGLCPVNVGILREKLQLNSREKERVPLVERGISMPNLDPLEGFLLQKGIYFH
jgi:hypothetical protein